MEELEDRLGDKMEEVLSHVKSSLTTQAGPDTANKSHLPLQDQEVAFTSQGGPPADGDEDAYYEEDIVFDDTGEGAGVEGDLDMEED